MVVVIVVVRCGTRVSWPKAPHVRLPKLRLKPLPVGRFAWRRQKWACAADADSDCDCGNVSGSDCSCDISLIFATRSSSRRDWQKWRRFGASAWEGAQRRLTFGFSLISFSLSSGSVCRNLVSPLADSRQLALYLFDLTLNWSAFGHSLKASFDVLLLSWHRFAVQSVVHCVSRLGYPRLPAPPAPWRRVQFGPLEAAFGHCCQYFNGDVYA